jgi:hypothetical protein
VIGPGHRKSKGNIDPARGLPLIYNSRESLAQRMKSVAANGRPAHRRISSANARLGTVVKVIRRQDDPVIRWAPS